MFGEFQMLVIVLNAMFVLNAVIKDFRYARISEDTMSTSSQR